VAKLKELALQREEENGKAHQREAGRRRREESLLKINRWLKVGKHNSLSGNALFLFVDTR